MIILDNIFLTIIIKSSKLEKVNNLSTVCENSQELGSAVKSRDSPATVKSLRGTSQKTSILLISRRSNAQIFD